MLSRSTAAPRAQGTEDAQSQQAEKQPGDPTIVWNLPIDATFQTTEPFGWPQISLQLYGPDFMGRTVMRGYGAVHVPTQAGHHEMYVQVFTPKSSSTFQSIQSTLMGTPPEFHNPKFATTGEARCVTRVQSLGTVKVCMDVVLVNMKALDLVS
jgi:B9 domain-containing protein 1